MLLRITLLAFAAALLLPAQTGQGTIVGSVNDTTGAVIAGVQIRMVHKETGFSYSPTTNEEGLYRQPYLNPGTYEVTFEAQGFKKLVRTAITVRSTETVRVDAQLEVGQVVESIEVGASATLLETETSSTGHLVSGRELVKLPSPQMKVESMLWYVPGVTSQGGFGHAAGGRSRSFQMTSDGVSSLTPGTGVIGTGRNMSTVQHNMEEIKVITTVLPAEYGHSGGGVMSIVFKSGTNKLHGLAEERYMARHFIHRNWQDAARPTNSFGFHLMSGTISGPVVIPKIYNGRNRTFFLAGFQRHHEKASENADATVPSPAMLRGDFSFGGIGDPIFDPASLVRLADGTYSRTQFPGNQLPLSRVDPVFNKFMSFNPYRPENNRNNQTFVNRQGVQNNISADTIYRSYRTGFDFKVDHSFSDRHKIFARESYFRHRSWRGRWQINVANPIFDINVPQIPIDQNQLVVSDTFTISPTVINEIRFGGNRRDFARTPESVGQNWASQLGIPGVGGDTMPNFRNAGGGILLSEFPGGSSQEIAENMSLQENLTIVRGRHTFKTGYELMRTRHNVRVATEPSGIYRMGGTEFPFRPNTGNAFASFMLGSVTRADFTRDIATWLPRWWGHAAYFQDDWKVNTKLTLNLGIRWQYESPFSTKWGQQSQFSPTAVDPLSGRQGALLHPTGLLSKRDLNNFQPRVGMAYTITPKLVFRGGFAVNTLDLWTNGLNENFEEYLATTTVEQAVGNPDVAFYLRNGPGNVTFPITNGISPFRGSNFSGRSASWFDPNMRMPYTMNWNGGFQYELGRGMVVELNYQGSASVGLLNRWDVNVVPLNVSSDPVQLERIRTSVQNFKPYPQFGSVFHYSNFGHSSFHGGTIKVDKRYSHGLSFTSFFTWAKAIDEASDDGGAGGVTFYNRRLEKARSNYDVPKRWVTYATWEMPFGKGKKWMNSSNWFVNGLLGNWELNAIQTFENGLPLTFGFTGTGNVFLPGAQRANMAPGKTYKDIKLDWDAHGPCRHQVACAQPWADINAFAYPNSFTAGGTGRNILTGPGMLWHQASLSKTFVFFERLKGSLRYDINNPFKRYFFNQPNATVDFRNPQNFGKINGNQGSFSGQGGRTYQMIILKLEF